MHLVKPVLFEVAGWAVPTHEFFIGIGVAAATGVFVILARKEGALTEQTLWIAVGGLISGAVFAKLATAWQFTARADSIADLWLHGGRSILGGLAGAYVGVEITKRLLGYRRSTGDLFAPAVATGMAVGRVGCFLTEQIGSLTGLPWGITLAPEVAATVPNCPQCSSGLAMHPSFLYEIVFHSLAFLALWRYRDRLAIEGESFKLYLLAYGLFRFALEFVRGNPEMAFGMSGSQLFLIVTVPLLLVRTIRKWRSGPYLAVAEATT